MTEVTQDHKDAQIAANRLDYDAKYNSLTVELDGKTYQASPESIEQMVRNLSLTSLPDGFFWVDLSNTKVTFDRAALQNLADTSIAARFDLYSSFQDRRDAINAATTFEELEKLKD